MGKTEQLATFTPQDEAPYDLLAANPTNSNVVYTMQLNGQIVAIDSAGEMRQLRIPLGMAQANDLLVFRDPEVGYLRLLVGGRFLWEYPRGLE